MIDDECVIEKDHTSKNDMYCDVCKKRNAILTNTKHGWVCDICLRK